MPSVDMPRFCCRPSSYGRPRRCAATYAAAEARAYTRWLATHHYENFHVVSFLLPKRLHQDFYNVYAYCRWADDLGDEIGDRAESLRLLDWWRERTGRHVRRAAPRTRCSWRSLETVRQHAIPRQPFADLIHAFVQDQTVTRYRDWDELFGYCRYSANPVGRLVLYLCGYSDAERQRLSDATCTALQLANFWQDVTVDLLKDRVYIPLDVMERHGYTVEELCARRFTPAFREVMREAVEKARELFLEGLPLAGMVDRRLALDLDLFSRGGMRVLDKIERQDYDVLRRAAGHFEGRARAAAAGLAGAHWPSRGRPDERSRAILRVLPARGARPRQELLLLLPAALRAAAQGHVRHLRLHALLRRSERRAGRHARGHRALARGDWRRRSRAASAAIPSGRRSITRCAASASRTSISAR